ncbi:MAG: imelysin family protein [Algicola sp.]|nr:imelysin family protein [Algicola sp.]
MNSNTKSTGRSIGLFKQSMIAIVVLAVVQGCGEGGSSSVGTDYGQAADSGSGGVDYDHTQLLANLADNIILPTYQSFQTNTVAQTVSLNAYCDALAAGDADLPTQQQSAQNHWKTLSAVWQQAEMMQIGPLSANQHALRNTIYSWPVVSACGVDQDVVYFQQGNINGTQYQISQRTDTRRGIDALEHLLFSQNLNHSCNGNVGPLGDWNIRTDMERMIARCDFAIVVADDINQNATTLVNAWSGDSGYAAKLKSAGENGSDFETSLQGVNAISDAMFYLDSVTKDGKLGKPLGKKDNSCANAVCPSDVESALSAQSVEHIVANVVGFSKLFYGSQSGLADGEGVGFDDYLIAVGDEQTALRITQGLLEMQQLADQLQMPLAELLVTDAAQVEALYARIKVVTDEMKTSFITSLALDLPQTSAGDND